MRNKMAIAIIVPIAVILLIAIVILGVGVGMYNGFVNSNETVDTAKAEVFNRLQQRHDKMGQIIAAVEGLQDHAEDIYQMITEARAAYAEAKTTSEYIQSDLLEAVALTELIAVVEDNPNITGNQAYYAYIDEVSAMENALAVARRDYNDAVKEYNVKAKKFPGNIIVKMFSFESQLEYWKVDNGATEVPIVDFTD